MNFWSWKPLLAFNAAFLLYVLARGRGASRGDTARRCVGLGAAWSVGIAAVVIAAYLPSLGANFVHQDWTQRVNTENVSIAHLFFRPVADRSWRPVGFLSIWVDNQIFGPRLWGYHLQNIALHGLNAVLAGVLACALGLSAWAARFTALLFGLGAIRFEAVVWPGARFDLLATAFMMLAVLLFLRGAPWWSVTAAFVLAVMSKETGYSLLLVIPAVSFLVRGGAGGFGCQDAEGHPEQPAHAGSAGETAACPTLAMSVLGLGVCAAALIAIRFALYGSLGGLAGVFHFSARTVYLLLR